MVTILVKIDRAGVSSKLNVANKKLPIISRFNPNSKSVVLAM